MGKREEQRMSTKLAILAAFERLCEQTTYTRISVADICKEAGVSKPTFYRHFQNKDNIVRWLAKRSLDGGVCEVGRTCSWYEGYLRTLTIQYRHRAFFCNEQSSEVVGGLFSFSSQYRREKLLGVIKDRGLELSDKISFQIDGLLVVESVASRRWGANGMQTPPSVIADYMVSCVPHDLFKLLDVPMSRAAAPETDEYPEEL